MASLRLDARTRESSSLPVPREWWRAVLERDATFRTSFVYAVNSTGVFCRPTCPSRRPRESQVVFFSTAAEAERAGYRPCLRCDPRGGNTQPRDVGMMVERACRYIEENYDSRITLKSLAETLGGISPFYLQRKFKQVLGLSPRQYLESIRLKRLKLSLARGESAVRSTYSAGYNTSSWLYSGSRLGMNPSAYKNGGERELIRYVTAECNLGRLLVGGTDRGVCAVSLGDSDDELLAHLREEYPKAEIVPESKYGGNSLSLWVANILECLVQGRDLARIGLPLDVCGTAFQFRVWHELRKIPRGSTKSYSEIAREVGCPKGSRAVASACARNHVALLIPCHRVVRKGGGELGGYRWGVERKKILLEQEREKRS